MDVQDFHHVKTLDFGKKQPIKLAWPRPRPAHCRLTICRYMMVSQKACENIRFGC